MNARVAIDQSGRQRLLVVLEDELILGRDCEGLLLADTQVSRRHLRLRAVGGEVEVTDLDSTNGSFLDGERLAGTERVTDRARVVIGDTTLRIEVGAAVGAGAGSGFGRQTDLRPPDDLRTTSIDRVADLVNSGRIELDADGELPDGRTTTIVFSDIESSTERANEIGDEPWFELLEAHNALVRAELGRCGGREIKSIGDGFMMTFDSVRASLRFASAVQRRFVADDGPDLRVRMGLHTGEAIADDAGDLYGRHVNLAARVANLAVGGQVLVSLVAYEIATGRDDVVYGAPATAELKGFADPQTVYELLWQEGSLTCWALAAERPRVGVAVPPGWVGGCGLWRLSDPVWGWLCRQSGLVWCGLWRLSDPVWGWLCRQSGLVWALAAERPRVGVAVPTEWATRPGG